MAEILGLGVTHFPPLAGHDENMAGILERILNDPALPELRAAAGGLARCRCAEEYGTDKGRPPPGVIERICGRGLGRSAACSTTSSPTSW